MAERQLRFHIPGEVCDTWYDEPTCEECDRDFQASQSREINDCVVWADLVVGDPGYGEFFYLLSPAEGIAWAWRNIGS